ncbi:unnamed protein product [Bursaphelenchus xylophilus]|uniref:(pine wood nematode) hypothetical protein n=1 Tax=Bursaphelenchus xylophilus TaxID=6326 RepID=A0A1I7RHR9_BURXY|nr:unnamed protein product [Bursaphelenchus xylophilus]CAG9115455.1 unnamed protein product [Bursaphelenchus xylophilus]
MSGSPPKKIAKTEELAPIFSKPMSSKGTWTELGKELLFFTPDGIENREKIAGFDMDGTLIKTKSGNVFPKNPEDWQLWDHSVSKKIRQAHQDGFKICIFTNQKGLETKKVNPADLKKKIQKICGAIGVPIQAFVSPGSSKFRKPSIGMWEFLENEGNGGVKVNRGDSVYVGDAAGRIKTPERPKADHSSADRLFALNLGVRFQTPEQFFLDQKSDEPYKMPPFDPKFLLENSKPQFEPELELNNQITQILLLVGSPASGKSHLSKWLQDEYGFTIVNQDTLGTKEKCLKKCKELIEEGEKVVVDNTNRDKATRKNYIDLARRLSVPIRCVKMNIDYPQAAHLNTFRTVIGAGKVHKGVNSFVLKQYFNAYQEPKEEEGFEKVVTCNFVPKFEKKEHEEIFFRYLNE